MNQQRTVSKLLLEVEEFGLNLRTALNQAYAAGYDERGMDLNRHKTVRITKYSASGAKIHDYESISQAAAMNGIARDTVRDILRGRTKMTRNKQYFRYHEET